MLSKNSYIMLADEWWNWPKHLWYIYIYIYIFYGKIENFYYNKKKFSSSWVTPNSINGGFSTINGGLKLINIEFCDNKYNTFLARSSKFLSFREWLYVIIYWLTLCQCIGHKLCPKAFKDLTLWCSEIYTFFGSENSPNNICNQHLITYDKIFPTNLINYVFFMGSN